MFAVGVEYFHAKETDFSWNYSNDESFAGFV